MREVNMLRRRDAGMDKIAFVDIDAPDYDPAQNAGISYEQVTATSLSESKCTSSSCTHRACACLELTAHVGLT